MTMRWLALSKCQRGAAAAELALMLPLMIIVLFGMFEGGHFLWSEHKVIKGVRDGARYAARQPFAKFDCSSSTLADTSLESEIRNVTIFGHPDPANSSDNVTDVPAVPGWDELEVTVTVACDSATTTGLYVAVSGGAPKVTVAADVPYTPLFGSIGFNVSSLSLKGEAQAAVMGL